MAIHKKVAFKADVEMQRPEDGSENEVAFVISTPDKSPLTSNQILEAVAECLILHWDHAPIEPFNYMDYDA